jgi:hypothetical protein
MNVVKETLIVIGGVCIVAIMFAAARFLPTSIPPALLNPDVTEAPVVSKAENVSTTTGPIWPGLTAMTINASALPVTGWGWGISTTTPYPPWIGCAAPTISGASR